MQNRDRPVLGFASAADWEAWLAENGAASAGLGLKIGKRGASEPGVTYDEALDVALCHGWIDGQKNPFDEESWLQRFTPRRPGSKWSRRNRDKATDLIVQGRMRPAGLREVEAARADGRWEAAYAGSSTIEVPDDLRHALEANPAARDFFATLDRTNRYAILYRVEDAKRPETRARRIATFVAMLAEGKKLHP
ncbi:MAG: YdeI/OmpD-associated family protein [Chloroflexota bacterium]